MTLLVACVITVAVETAFFALLGYRNRDSLIIVAGTNAVTNLTLNLSIWFLSLQFSRIRHFLLPFEIAVVVAEYLVYSRAFGRSKRLFWQTFAANVITFTIGAAMSLFGVWYRLGHLF